MNDDSFQPYIKTMADTTRKNRIVAYYNECAFQRLAWKAKSRFFHDQDLRYLSFLIPQGQSILDVGCGIGDTLTALKPAKGFGIDISENMIREAVRLNPGNTYLVGDIEDRDIVDSIDGEYDFILLSDTIGSLEDCQGTLQGLHRFCTDETRLVVSYYSYLWNPLLKLAEFLNMKMPQPEMNFLLFEDIRNLLELAGFEVVKKEWRQMVPIRLFGLGDAINRYIATLPLIRNFCLRHYVVARSRQVHGSAPESCTVVIPCRNEKGNIEAAVRRLPLFCADMEIIFMEGHSQDGTMEEINRVMAMCPERNIIALRQTGTGKANAVHEAFDAATKDVLMILDADLTIPPEDLTKFWEAIVSGNGEFINGSRLVYPLEKDAMRFLNQIANHTFSILFSWLLNQRFTDTLCGTKVLRRKDYLKIKANKDYFGDFDPFGDFDLIFGSAILNLKMMEIPVRYKARRYGSTQISRFKHGLQLLQMFTNGYFKLKAI